MTAITVQHRVAMEAAYGQSLGNVSFPVGSLKEWQLGTLEKLAELRELNQNWDSYGSPPISDNVLQLMRNLVTSTDVSAAIPRVVPLSGGGVQLEWEQAGKTLIVAARSDSSIELLADDGSDEPIEATVPSLNPSALNKLLLWMQE